MRASSSEGVQHSEQAKLRTVPSTVYQYTCMCESSSASYLENFAETNLQSTGVVSLLLIVAVRQPVVVALRALRNERTLERVEVVRDYQHRQSQHSPEVSFKMRA